MKSVKKAIIPAAGLGTRFLPVTRSIPKEMLPIIDVPALQLIVEEAVNSGIEEIIIVISRQKLSIKKYFEISSNKYLKNSRQKHPDLDRILIFRKKVKIR
jgi:UTP--glucose-1-phosphate uridylyltransferase